MTSGKGRILLSFKKSVFGNLLLSCVLFLQNQEIEELTKICDELIAKMGKTDWGFLYGKQPRSSVPPALPTSLQRCPVHALRPWAVSYPVHALHLRACLFTDVWSNFLYITIALHMTRTKNTLYMLITCESLCLFWVCAHSEATRSPFGFVNHSSEQQPACDAT